MRLLMAELSKKKDGPDVICGWRQLLAVLNAATCHHTRLMVESGDRSKGRTLLRHIETIEGWMSQAKELEEYADQGL
jgi:hypothetical protein